MTADLTRAEVEALLPYGPTDDPIIMRQAITQLLRQLDAANARADAAAEQMRQAMAAYALAFNEPDRDVESDENCRRQTASWFAHWMVNNYPKAHEGEAHSGDCTKQPWTCMRCCADEAFADVDAALAEWNAIATLPIHEETKP